ncbi:MAG: hypothetical protein ABI824_12755, partial [Acidobacteriota bacterium]
MDSTRAFARCAICSENPPVELKQSSTLADRYVLAERAMDSNDLEKERGITILAKNTAIRWNDW